MGQRRRQWRPREELVGSVTGAATVASGIMSWTDGVRTNTDTFWGVHRTLFQVSNVFIPILNCHQVSRICLIFVKFRLWLINWKDWFSKWRTVTLSFMISIDSIDIIPIEFSIMFSRIFMRFWIKGLNLTFNSYQFLII